MNRHKPFTISFVVIFITITSGFSVFALDHPKLSHNVLSGLRSIFVQVVIQDKELGNKGFDSKQIEKGVIRQLKDAGIETIPEKEYIRLRRPRNYPLAILEVEIESISAKGLEGGYSIHVNVMQLAFLSRRPVIRILAPTWERFYLDFKGSSASGHTKIQELVEEFTKEFLAENPK